MRILSAMLILLVLTLSACGGSSSSEEGKTTLEEAFGGGETETVSRSTEYFGENGNLWKPAAEEKSSTAGLLVVLLGPQHTGQFDSCSLEHIDGSTAQLDCNDRVPWSHEPYSCVANGNREHWRASFTCDKAALTRVVCRNSSRVLTVEGRGPGISAVCSRLG